MQFSTKTSSPDRLKTDCLIVPVLAGKDLTVGGKSLDAACDRRLTMALKSGDLAAKAGSTLLLHLEGPAARALLVSLGDEREPGEKAFVEAARGAIRHLGTLGAAGAASLLHEAPAGHRDLAWKIRTQVMAARDAGYRFDAMKSRKETKPAKPGALVFVVGGGAETTSAGHAIRRAEAIANGMSLAKDLGNLPPNVCTPAYLAAEARKLGRSHKIKVEVLEQRQIQALKMGALLAVAQGSDNPPKFIVMHYNGGGAKEAPVVLVGKGITFDTGGISLKPAAEMDEMKYDMSGAGSVLGTMRAVAEMKLELNVIGVVPTCENMPSGKATRPGDVVTSMSGQTVEILNTDAEGRLILCDALTYVERFKPAAVIDIATLTGACVIALGNHHSGLFTKDDNLADELTAAGRDIADTCWRMPVDEDYAEALKSNFADMGNVGGRAGGAITAACFLAKFTKAYPWAHLDIAGTAWRSGAQKGSSGRPVPLLANFLIGRAKG